MGAVLEQTMADEEFGACWPGEAGLSAGRRQGMDELGRAHAWWERMLAGLSVGCSKLGLLAAWAWPSLGQKENGPNGPCS